VLFASVRELLLNIVKHSHAHSAKVRVQRDGNHVRIVVEDDGVGFNRPGDLTPTAASGGFGLFNVRERLQYFGGQMQIESELGRGARIILTAPLGPDAEKEGKHGNKDHSGRRP
jgi:signal transduction histidine kinase